MAPALVRAAHIVLQACGGNKGLRRDGCVMSKRHKTRITIETERIVLRHPRRASVWCPKCAEPSRMVSADEAALLLHTSTRATWYWAEAGKLHCQETTEGLLRICLRSLLNFER